MSPAAAYALYNTYRTGGTDDIFFMTVIETKQNYKIMLYTSIDIIVLLSYNTQLIGRLIKVDQFITDDLNPNAFYQNLIMLLLLKIPDTQTVAYFETNKKILDILPIINNHYKYMCKYNIRSITKRFSDFIGLE